MWSEYSYHELMSSYGVEVEEEYHEDDDYDVESESDEEDDGYTEYSMESLGLSWSDF